MLKKHLFFFELNSVGIFLLVLTSLFIFSCNRKTVYSKEYAIDSGIWQAQEKKEFDIEISDLNALYDIYLIFNIDKDYSTNNLWLDITSTSPSGNSETDTLMFFVCDNTGKWLGETKGDVVYNQFLFKKGIKFPEKGIYKIEYEHRMRDHNLPKIQSAGILVEYSKMNSN
jgi:gliding motility-associated lipoprotein GldH